MKRTLFYSTIALKSLIGFCDPITQEALERELNLLKENSNITVTVRDFENFPCPSRVIFCKKEEDSKKDSEKDLEKEFFEKFPPKEEISKDIFVSEKTAFKKYSRELDIKDMGDFKGLNKDSVRIIDFESIVDGFDNEALKAFAKKLNEKEDELKSEIKKWLNQKNIYACLVPALLDGRSIVYIPHAPIENHCKGILSKTIEKLLKYKVGQQVLNLVLCIEKFENKTLKFFIGGNGYCTSHGVFLGFSSNDIWEANDLYYELKSWVYHVLGLNPSSKIAGDFSTAFEKVFLGLEADDFYKSGAAELKEEEAFSLVDTYLPEREDKETALEINKEIALKVVDIQKTWWCLENLWHDIGFANIGGIIYVSRLSDMDLLKYKPVWGEKEKMHADGPKEPDAEAWKAWLKLHKLPENTEYMFLPDLIKIVDQKEKESFKNLTKDLPIKISEEEQEAILEQLSDPATYENFLNFSEPISAPECLEITKKFRNDVRSINRQVQTLFLSSAMDGGSFDELFAK